MKTISIMYRNDTIKMALLAIVVGFIYLEFISVAYDLLFGLQNMPLPWDWVSTAKIHSKIVFIAILFSITIFIVIGWLYVQKGFKRWLSYWCIGVSITFFIATWIGLLVFCAWQGIKITIYPWQLFELILALQHSPNVLSTLIWCLLGCYGIVVGLFMYYFMTKSSKDNNVYGNAHFANAYEINKSGLFSDEGIVIGKAYGKILRQPGFESVLITAPMGAGKTTAIAIPNLLEWSGSGIFNDLKGELYRTTAAYRKDKLGNACYLWSPSDEKKGLAQYNPFYYVNSNRDLRIRDFQLIAEIMIPAERVDGGFWYTSSRDIFIMLALFLFETKGMATLSEIHDLSKQADFIGWLDNIVCLEEVTDPIFVQNANSLLNSDEKTQKNILKDFHSRMTLFMDPLVRYATDHNSFDIREIRKKKMSIYIHIPEADKERLKPLLTLFWAQTINLLTLNEPDIVKEPYPVLALLEEFGNMARINKLKDGMSFLRSYRIRAIIIVQYLSQIASVYGREDAKGFLNCKVKVSFALNDPDDAQFISKCLGTKTVKVKSRSASHGHHSSTSHNIGLQGKPLMTSDQIMQLNKDKAIILIESQIPVLTKKCYYYKNAKHIKDNMQ